MTRIAFSLASAATLSLVFSPVSLVARTNNQQKPTDPPILSDHQKHVIAAFQRHVKDYLKQRDKVRKKLPKVSKDATPEQIQAYQKSFVDALIALRAGTKPGYMFNTEMADYIRTLIKTEFKGSERVEVRQAILEAETKGVPLKINYPYPEKQEVTQMPPTLLLKLPQLPKEVKYRFVRQHMLLVDSDNDLIVDYMLKALP